MGNVTIKVKAKVKALLIIFVVVSYLLVKMVGPLVVLGLVAVVGQAMGTVGQIEEFFDFFSLSLKKRFF